MWNAIFGLIASDAASRNQENAIQDQLLLNDAQKRAANNELYFVLGMVFLLLFVLVFAYLKNR